jgi:SAM-dependent methyltransferase
MCTAWPTWGWHVHDLLERQGKWPPRLPDVHHADMTTVNDATQRFWEDFYKEHGHKWSGKPNALLVREVAALDPGTALDVGCGEGADALWLAERGWRVTAVDVSEVAIGRAAARAAETGVGERIAWERHDLSRSFPEGVFDLVSVQFFHSPIAEEGERESVLSKAAGAVAPGGTLLIAGHAGWPSWVTEPPFDHRFPTTSDVLDGLDLAPGEWRVEAEEVVENEMTDPDGRPGWRTDNVLRVRRLP